MIIRKFANEKGSSKTRVEYVHGKGHEHKCEKVEFVGGNIISHEMDDLIEEMDTPCHLRQAATGKDSGKCHMHYMLSLPEGEVMSPGQWRQVLDKTMSALGYTEDYKFFGMLHHDTDNQHMHVLANRISMRDYNLLSESNDYEVLMQVCREIEFEYGLQVVPMPHETFGVNLTREEVEASRKSGQIAWKHKLIARVATALEHTQEKGGNMLDFIKALKRAEIGVELTTDKSGKPTGISYKFEGKSISGRQLKRSRFTWQYLTRREGIHYDESMLSELQKAVRTRNAEPKEKTGPEPTSHTGILVTSPQAVKPKGKVFAIVVHADRHRRTPTSRIWEPTYTKNSKLFYLFNINVKLTKEEVEQKKMNEFVARAIKDAIQLAEAILSIFRCKIEIDYDPDDMSGPIYSLAAQQAPAALIQAPAPSPA